VLSVASHITKIIGKLCAGKPHAQFERGLHGNGPAVTLEPRHNLPMSLKSAAFFALIGMILLTVLLAVGFIRDVSALLAGAIAAVVLLTSLIHLLASLSLAVFLYVFHKGQG